MKNKYQGISKTKIRILCISPDLPYPPDQGCKVDIWGHISFFHNIGAEVILVLCKSAETRNPDTYEHRFPIKMDFHFVPRSHPWNSSENPETVSQIQNLVNSYKPNIIWCEYAHFSSLVSQLNLYQAKLWFRPHNFELAHAIDKILAERPWHTWSGLKGLNQALSWTRHNIKFLRNIYLKEKLMHQISDHLFFISYKDLKIMSKIYRKSIPKDWVLPFLESYVIPVKPNKTCLDIIYIGGVGTKNTPNMIGARLLLNEIIPAVKKQLSHAFRFHLVGRGLSRKFEEYSSNSVFIHDYISDLEGFLNDMDIACVPVNVGWGCKIKMIEALASGLPTVGAREAFRGVPDTTGAYFSCNVIQDYVEAFEALQSYKVREEISAGARTAYLNWIESGQQSLESAINSL